MSSLVYKLPMLINIPMNLSVELVFGLSNTSSYSRCAKLSQCLAMTGSILSLFAQNCAKSLFLLEVGAILRRPPQITKNCKRSQPCQN